MVRRHAISHKALPQDLAPDEAFSMAAAAGFEAVEMLPAQGEGHRRAVREASRATGVRISAVECGRAAGAARLDGDGDELEANVDLVLAALHDAEAWGARGVLVVPGRLDEVTSAEVSWQRSAEVMATRLVPVAEELGVVLGVENTWWSCLLTAAELARFVDEQESDAVGAYFDVGNVVFGHPELWVPVLGRRLVGVHYKDVLVRSRHRDRITRFTAPGSGDVDWSKVDVALAEAGYDGWLTQTVLPLPVHVRAALRLDGILSDRSGPAARRARSVLRRPRLGWHGDQLAEIGQRARDLDTALADALDDRPEVPLSCSGP